MGAPLVMALDEGSTSARTVIVDVGGAVVAEARAEVTWTRRRPGWAELDPVALWQTQLATVNAALAQVDPADIATIAVTSHRETVLVWDRETGRPVYDALVWISTQTDDIVRRWSERGLDDEFVRRTGLPNNSFFSAAKLSWLLDEVPGVREGALAGRYVCGTIDSWLLWNLTDGRSHLTDHSCASRTALFDLHTLAWSEELCDALDIPIRMLPRAVASDSDFGLVTSDVVPGLRPGGVPVRGVIADQQASMVGQACFAPGSVKQTFGTAGVLCVNTGAQPAVTPGLTSSVGWTVQGRTRFELEAVAFHSGQTLHWLRDNFGLIDPGDSIDDLVRVVPDTGGVYLVPAMAGLCAPYWERAARASIVGMSMESTRAHVVRAAVESMAYQAVDALVALAADGRPVSSIKVDGGAARNDVLCQFFADVSGILVQRPVGLERTAIGAAQVAGIGHGLWSGLDEAGASWSLDRCFEPAISATRREELYSGWRHAVESTLTFAARQASPAGAAVSTPSPTQKGPQA